MIVGRIKQVGRQDQGYMENRAAWALGNSLRAKWMCLFFIFFFTPYAVLTFLSVSSTRRMMKQGTMNHLQNLVEVKETAIEQWLKDRTGDGKTTKGYQRGNLYLRASLSTPDHVSLSCPLFQD